MKPILVHVHIYYPELWNELKKCLENISPYSYDLFITLVKQNDSLQKSIIEFNPNAKIYILDNKGYDIGPFLEIINQLNLDNYSYIIKLHTKRNIKIGSTVNRYVMSENLWRNYLLSFIENKKIFHKVMSFLETKKNVGMISNYKLIMYKEKYDQEAYKNAKLYLKTLNLPIKNFCYIAGTMFIARASIFKEIQKLNISLHDFEYPDRTKKTSKAHTIERLIGWIVGAQDFYIVDCFTPKLIQFFEKFYHPFRRLILNLYRVKENQKGEITVKVLGFTIKKYSCKNTNKIL
ncbi:MAG: hypothetical protein M0R46_01835 [Candidatus Muirbacterium halophilum]|nr:hypothetical protein [Candidatus Muirbacterium halophilum]MCK9474636.1 hypothetical protein [Candidatus Muirbacterium halophilum]